MCKAELTRQRLKETTSRRDIDAAGDLLATEATQPLVAAISSGEGRVKKTSELWHIHGKRFDLSGFLKHHPGGSSILEAVRGAEDATAMFESYHALANTAAIRQSLQKFEWTDKVLDDVSEREATLVGGSGKKPIRYEWNEAGFYAVLKTRVKQHFLEKHGQGGVDPHKASVNRFVKAPLSWYLKELFILVVYVPMFIYMSGYDILRLGGASVSGWARAGFAVLAGAVLQAFSFCTLHDASHYGLLFKRPRAQEVLSRVCNAWTLWHHGLWVMHHVYGHHSFTGDPERDPDLVHARPYLRKSVLTPKEQYDPFLVRWQKFLAPLFMMVLPGATLGQTQAYLRAARVGHLWHVSITEASGATRWYEYLTYSLAVGVQILGGNLWVSFCYFMGISVAYHLCVAPDHDTFESSIVNSIEAKRENMRREMFSGAVAASAEQKGGAEGDNGNGVKAALERKREGNTTLGSDRGSAEGDTSPIAEGQVSEGVDGNPIDRRNHVGQQRIGKEEDSEEEGDDWGEVQVRHSGNFSNGSFFMTQAMGGINYQIEHHLFPSVSHMLYEEIAPIVREACHEFRIPYNVHPTLWSAYKSYLKHLVLCSDVASTP